MYIFVVSKDLRLHMTFNAVKVKLTKCHSTNTLVLFYSGGRGLGAAISKFKPLYGCNYDTFYTLIYNSCVVPIFSYGAGTWGYKKKDEMLKKFTTMH